MTLSIIKFYEEADDWDEEGGKRIVKGQDFDITLMKGPGRLHICGRDEFFYVLRGEGEVLIDDKLYVLKQHEGIMVRAGEKHKRGGRKEVCWLVFSKHPHKHIFFEEEPTK